MTIVHFSRPLLLVLVSVFLVGCRESTGSPVNSKSMVNARTTDQPPNKSSRFGVLGRPKTKTQLETEAEATWDYWEKLSAVAKSINSLDAVAKNAKTPGQWNSYYDQAETALTKAATEISTLSILNVNSEATSYATKLYTQILRMKFLVSDIKSLISSVQQLRKHANSPDAFAESFIRGFLGDPLGKHNEMRQQASQLDTSRRRLVSRWQGIVETVIKIDAEGLLIRASLTRKYGRDFPNLGS